MVIKPEINNSADTPTNHQIIAQEELVHPGYPLKPVVTIIDNYLAVNEKLNAVVPKYLSPAEIAARIVTPIEFRQWSKVSVCEEGGNWHLIGSKFSGGLGISVTNWNKYGGTFFASTGAAATPDEQIVVAMRIQHQAPTPDQNGCLRW
jgi:hypothetical protein